MKSIRLRIYPFFSILAIIALLAAATSACQKQDDQNAADLQGSLSISGAWALYPLMVRWADEYQKLNPGVKIDISAGGAGKGMADVLAGAVDLAMVSRDVNPDEETQGAYVIPVTKDAVFPMVNVNNPALPQLLELGLTREALIGIYITGEIKTWGQLVNRPDLTDEIHVYTRSDACGAGETWAKYLGGTQETLLGVGVYGDPGLADAVIKDPLGIGYNNLGYAYDLASGHPVSGLVVAPIDSNQNGKADADEILETMKEATEMVIAGRYPSPPARVLNLVTKGKPSGLAQAFLEWILTDGQKYVDEAGYVRLDSSQLKNSLQKLR